MIWKCICFHILPKACLPHLCHFVPIYAETSWLSVEMLNSAQIFILSYSFSKKTCLSTEKNHLTAKFRNPSITFAAIIICTYLRFRLINRRMNMINVRRLTVIAFLGAGPAYLPKILLCKSIHWTKQSFPLNGTCNRVSTMPLSRILRFVKIGLLRQARRLMWRQPRLPCSPASPSLPASRLWTGRIRNQVAESVAVRLSVPTVKPVTMETTD